MWMDLPWFNGSMNIEDFLNWLSELERFFEYMDIKDKGRLNSLAYCNNL